MPRNFAVRVSAAGCCVVLALTSLCVHAADPAKVLRVSFPIAEAGFDPQAAADASSNYVNHVIFDPLYQYDFLARPYKVVPNTAEALPQISADGTAWTIKVKRGIYFSDDPAFKGKKRELTAGDYIYAWKRLIDPKLRSFNVQILDDRIVGARAAIAAASKTGKFDYDAVIEGMQAIDRYTIRLKLNYPSYDLLSELTGSATSAVAREVVEAYGDPAGWVMEHPVGTGPFVLKDWRRAQKIVLEANPNFRDVRFPVSTQAEDRSVMEKMRGKKLPAIGRVEISIIEESNPRLLAFEGGELDYLLLPSDLVPKVLQGDKLQPQFEQRGVTLGRGVLPAVSYTYFNMEDPVVGGYGNEKIALRRAIGMAYNNEEEIRVLRHGQGAIATQLIPPVIAGHDPSVKANLPFDAAGAKALLDKFGYVDRDGDTWRDLPDGKPLTLHIASDPSGISRQYDELWLRGMTSVGIRVEFVKQKWPELMKMGLAGQLQMWRVGITTVSDEATVFADLLYGPHKGVSNLSRFDLPEFNALFDQTKRLPNGPERNRLFRQMSALASAYAPLVLHAFRYENIVVYPWVLGYKYNTFDTHPWMYYDIDVERRRAAGK